LGGTDGADDIQRPVIIGSILPQVNHLTNKEIGQVDRTPNDQVELITDSEHFAQYAPDYTGISRGPDPEKFYPQAVDPQMEGPPDFDNKWKLHNEDDKKFFFSIRQQSGDNTFIQHPDGRMQLHHGDGNGSTLSAIEMHPDGHVTSFSVSGHTDPVPSRYHHGKLIRKR